MSCDIVNRNFYARDLVYKLYRDAADEDYIAARYFAKVDLHFNFFWSAQQALEKIVKATLLLNGENTSDFRHGLSKSFEMAQGLSGDLLPILLVPHNSFPSNSETNGYAQPASEFIHRIETQGDANNRYRHYGISFNFHDLYKLDEVYFTLRRTAVPLSMQETSGETYLDFLRRNRSIQLNEFKCLTSGKRGARGYTDSNNTFKWQNFAFCEKDAVLDGHLSTGWSDTTSPLYMASQAGAKGTEALEWICEAAYFSGSDKIEIKDLIQEMKKVRA